HRADLDQCERLPRHPDHRMKSLREERLRPNCLKKQQGKESTVASMTYSHFQRVAPELIHSRRG
ncbi:hypothetical protein ACVBEH_29810, partial [Roseateles sp. GG27B]